MKNTYKGFAKLERWLKENGATRSNTVLCSEHTGRYSERLSVWLSERNWKHSAEKTTILKKVSGEHPRKEDGYDAGLLSEYAFRYTDKLHMAPPKAKPVRQLQRLRAERRAMVDSRSRLKQKLTEAGYHAVDMDELISL